jgi:anti-sigma B factor antagonist
LVPNGELKSQPSTDRRPRFAHATPAGHPPHVRTRTEPVKRRAAHDDAVAVNAFVPPVPTPPLDLPEGFHLAQEPLPTADPGLLLAPVGELDIATAPELRSTIADALDSGVARLVVDLSGLSFLDSVAVAVLLHTRRQLGDAGRMSVVVPPDSYAQLVFGVAGLSHCLNAFATRDAAIAHAAA